MQWTIPSIHTKLAALHKRAEPFPIYVKALNQCQSTGRVLFPPTLYQSYI